MTTIVCMILDATQGDKFKPELLYWGCAFIDIITVAALTSMS